MVGHDVYVLYSQGEGKKNVVYPLDTYQEMKNTHFDRIDTRLMGKIRFFYPHLYYTVLHISTLTD